VCGVPNHAALANRAVRGAGNVAFRREFKTIGVLFFLAPFITLLSPQATVPLFILLSAGSVTIALIHGQTVRELFRFDPGFTLFVAVTGYLLINATWSLDPSRAVGKAVWFAIVSLMAFGASRAICAWHKQQIRVAGVAFLAGLSAGIAFVLFEVATNQLLLRLLYNVFPITRPDSLKALVMHEDQVFRIKSFELNRNIAVMLLLLWPALLCFGRLRDKRWRLLGIVVLCLAAATAIMLSKHDTSKVGLIFSAIAFLIALLWPTATRRAVWITWCLAFVLVVPLSSLALKAQLHQAEWLPASARARVILWAYTAEQIPAAPLLGIGLTSTRKLDMDPATRLEAAKPEGYVYAWRAGTHAHNEFLQAWYELGAVGVILLIAAGSSVIGYVGRLSQPRQAFMLAHLAAFLVIAAFSWGMWQSWLMAVTGLAAIYAALAVSFWPAEGRAPDERGRSTASPEPPSAA